jgi:methyl-accepting chemotaxis protein
VKNVENGSGIASETAKALEEIVDGISKVTDLVGEIASASKEQSQGIEQVNTALGQIDQVTQSNTANAEESAAAAEELSSQAEQLKSMISKFTLCGKNTLDEIDGSINNSVKTKSNGNGKKSLQGSENDLLQVENSKSNGEEKMIALNDKDFAEF